MAFDYWSVKRNIPIRIYLATGTAIPIYYIPINTGCQNLYSVNIIQVI